MYLRIDINPKGLVPALEYKNQALYESLIICEFIEDAYPDHSPQILPKEPFERARARLWVDHVSKAIIPAVKIPSMSIILVRYLNRLPQFFRILQAQEEAKQGDARKELYTALSTLSKNVKGPWFMGNEFGLVDIAIAPWALRDYVLGEHRGYDRSEVGNGWKEWAERLESRDSVVKTASVSLSTVLIIKNAHELL